MKNISSIVLITFLILSSVHAIGQIKVKFINSTQKDISIKITSGDNSSPQESYTEVYSQVIPSSYNENIFYPIKGVKKGKKIIVMGTIAGMGNFKFQEQSVVQKNQAFTISLTITASSVPPDKDSYQQLMNSLNFQVPPGTEKVMPAELAYKTYFGGLSLRKDGKEIDRIEPSVLQAEVSPMQFGNMNRNVELFFSGSFISNNKGSAPGIASVNLDIDQNHLYKLKYTLNNIGNVVWSSQKSVAQLFSSLNEIDKSALVKRFLADTTLRLYQYDNMYVFNLMNLQMEKYARTSATIDATVPVFFSSSTAYKKEEGENFTTTAGATVLNIWATKDITHLLAQASKDYLQKQQILVKQASSNKDAQNIIKTAALEGAQTITSSEGITKAQIVTELTQKIQSINTKETIQQEQVYKSAP